MVDRKTMLDEHSDLARRLLHDVEVAESVSDRSDEHLVVVLAPL